MVLSVNEFQFTKSGTSGSNKITFAELTAVNSACLLCHKGIEYLWQGSSECDHAKAPASDVELQAVRNLSVKAVVRMLSRLKSPLATSVITCAALETS